MRHPTLLLTIAVGSIACSASHPRLDCANSSYLKDSPVVAEFERQRQAHPSDLISVPVQFSTFTPADFHGITEMAVTYTECLGTCPSFTLRYLSSGEVTYIGHSCVPDLGRHMGHIDPIRLLRLVNAFEDIGFFDLHLGYTSDITDQSGTYVMAVRDGQPKVVLNYAGEAPPRLWLLEQALTGLASSVQWQGAAVRVPRAP